MGQGGGGGGGGAGAGRSTGPEVIMAWEPYLFAVPDKRVIFQNDLTGSRLYRHQQPTHPFLNFPLLKRNINYTTYKKNPKQNKK